MKIIFTASVLLLSTIACGPKTGPISDANDAKARALQYVSGSSTNAEKNEEGWVVLVKQGNGALAEVRMDPATGLFTAAEDKLGPFDYDLHPTQEALSFQQAVQKAKAIQAGNVTAWELERQEDGSFQWEIYVRNDQAVLYEIKLNGKDGALKEAKQKDAVD